MTWGQIVDWAEHAVSQTLQWAEAALDRTRHVGEQLAELPVDVLMGIVAYSSFAALFASVCWFRASARGRRCAEALLEAERQRTELQDKYDAEVKWRAATEAFDRAEALKPKSS